MKESEIIANELTQVVSDVLEKYDSVPTFSLKAMIYEAMLEKLQQGITY